MMRSSERSFSRYGLFAPDLEATIRFTRPAALQRRGWCSRSNLILNDSGLQTVPRSVPTASEEATHKQRTCRSQALSFHRPFLSTNYQIAQKETATVALQLRSKGMQALTRDSCAREHVDFG
jgi:hypothetical protein